MLSCTRQAATHCACQTSRTLRHQWFTLQANADPELVYGVNPAWRQVDRIIAERLAVARGQEVRLRAIYMQRWHDSGRHAVQRAAVHG